MRAELLDSQAHDPFQIVLSDEEQLLSETSEGGLENFRQISRFQPYFFSSSSSYPRYLVPYFKIFFQFSDILVVVVRFFGVFAKIKKKDRSPRSFKRSNGIVKLRTSSFHTTHLVWGIYLSEIFKILGSGQLTAEEDTAEFSNGHFTSSYCVQYVNT